MKVLNLVQGTPAWHEHRATAFNASDAPAMLGISKYKSRAQLIKERATGIIPEVDEATQRRFNDGHRFEALARPLAEAIIGEELSPMVGAEGKYSASFDGITFDGSIIFEHKSLNDELREAMEASDEADHLHEQYRAQMEHQLMVSGAKKCLFMASKFGPDDTLIEERHCWYYPDTDMRARLVAGWERFEKDVSAYVPTEVKEAPKAEAIQALPSVFVQATGMVTASNLSEFKEAATTFIAAIKTELVTDDDFANAEATVKFCKEAETNLDATKSSVLAQMSSVDEVVRTLDHIKKQLADKRLMLDKLVKSEKELRKGAIVTKADKDFTEYGMQLEAEIKPIGLNRSTISAARMSFADAIKGKKKLSAMQEAVDTALRDAKFAADQEAKDIRAKLAWCKENAAGKHALFPDLQQIITKPMDDFTLTITSRIEKAAKEEAERLEAERARIQAEEEAKARAKAQAEAAAKLAEETARIRKEEQAKAQAEAEQSKTTTQSEAVTHDERVSLSDVLHAAAPLEIAEAIAPVVKDSLTAVELPSRYSRPTDDEIIAALAENFRVHEMKVVEWLIDIDLNAASERIAKDF